MKNFAELVLDSKEPAIGPTPREEVYRKYKSRLFRYASPRKYRTPVLFVPNLGISRPYIFDLLPGASFIEYMTQASVHYKPAAGGGRALALWVVRPLALTVRALALFGTMWAACTSSYGALATRKPSP